jgi:hypothetical protein
MREPATREVIDRLIALVPARAERLRQLWTASGFTKEVAEKLLRDIEAEVAARKGERAARAAGLRRDRASASAVRRRKREAHNRPLSPGELHTQRVHVFGELKRQEAEDARRQREALDPHGLGLYGPAETIAQVIERQDRRWR